MYKDKKIILFAFASLDLIRSIKRLNRQATSSEYYDLIQIMSPSDLDQNTKLKLNDLFKKGKKRGYGYWLWKPYSILKIMQDIEDGDIIHYMDIGCHINKTKSNRFYDYLDRLIDTQNWLLPFQYHNNDIKLKKGIYFPAREEYKYTKADLLSYFNFLDNKNITHSPQYWAGSFFIKKNNYSIDFLNSWINIFENHFDLIDDSPSRIKNLEGFIENRHDQSVFSLLCKKNSINSISAYECEWGEKDNVRTWEHNLDYPILAKRDLEYNFIKRFILRQKKNFNRKKNKILNFLRRGGRAV